MAWTISRPSENTFHLKPANGLLGKSVRVTIRKPGENGREGTWGVDVQLEMKRDASGKAKLNGGDAKAWGSEFKRAGGDGFKTLLSATSHDATGTGLEIRSKLPGLTDRQHKEALGAVASEILKGDSYEHAGMVQALIKKLEGK